MEQFLKKHSLDKIIGDFPEKELSALKNQIPPHLFEWLAKQQRSSFGSGFFWSVLPTDYHEIITSWGLEGAKCYTFLRSSFGCLIYYYEGDIYALNPQKGIYSILGDDDINYLFDIALFYDTILDEYCCYDLHTNNFDKLPKIDEDEMYTLVPAIPLGGDYDSSKIEIVKLKEQLDILAQLYNNQAVE